MIDRSKINSAIIFDDIGYESYNILAHVQEKGWKFLFRVKDGIGGIVSGLEVPNTEEFDLKFDLKLTYRQHKSFKNDKNVRKLHSEHRFDFLTKNTPIEFFNLPFRIIRLKISDKTIETLITNLDFPPEELKELYNMRWGIETSFRDLKYTLKTLKFHSKSLEYARHEIFAGLIMYNFSALISSQAVLKSRKRKHIYKPNFSRVIKISMKYFCDKLKLKEVEKLIEKFILPVRKGRNNQHKILPKTRESFMYR